MNRTMFGVILAAFLVLSVGFIAPVQVQAAGIKTTQFKEEIVALAEQLQSDDNLEILVDNDHLRGIMSQMLASNDEAEIELMQQEYRDYIENNQALKEALDELEKDYSSKADRLLELAKSIVQQNTQYACGKTFQLEITDGALSVEQATEEAGQDEILLSSDGVLTLNGMDIGLIGFLLIIGAVVLIGIVYVIVLVIQGILTLISNFFDSLELLGIVVGVLMTIIGVIAIVLEEVIEQIAPNLLDALGIESISKSKRSRIQAYSQKIRDFFTRLRAMFRFRVQLQ